MKTSLRPTTWENYQTQVEKHLKPCLGKHALGNLKTSHIQQFYNAKMMGKRADKKEGGLSAKSIRNIHNVLHSALEQAFKEGLIRINPAKAVRLPRVARKEMQTLTQDDIKKFMEVAKQTPYYTAYFLELYTGLRRGELLALRWQDICFETGTVTVGVNLNVSI